MLGIALYVNFESPQLHEDSMTMRIWTPEGQKPSLSGITRAEAKSLCCNLDALIYLSYIYSANQSSHIGTVSHCLFDALNNMQSRPKFSPTIMQERALADPSVTIDFALTKISKIAQCVEKDRTPAQTMVEGVGDILRKQSLPEKPKSPLKQKLGAKMRNAAGDFDIPTADDIRECLQQFKIKVEECSQKIAQRKTEKGKTPTK